MKRFLLFSLCLLVSFGVYADTLRTPEMVAANAVAITGGAVDSTTVGATTPSTGAFTTLSASGAVTINDASADVDTRVETNGNANMLFIDGGDDAVGIGKDPASGTELDVNGDVGISGALTMSGSGNTVLTGTLTLGVATGNATITTGNRNLTVTVGGTTYYIKAHTSE